jgi:proteic killer suppression protein
MPCSRPEGELLDVRRDEADGHDARAGRFRCKVTEALFNGQRVARFRNIEATAMRKLAMLNRVIRVEELRIPPNNRLEALKGDRKSQWSIRINDRWRVCFRFADGRATDVEIVDCH